MKRRNFLKFFAGLPALALFPWYRMEKPHYLTGTYSWYGGQMVEEISEEWYDNASKDDIAQAIVDLTRWRNLNPI